MTSSTYIKVGLAAAAVVLVGLIVFTATMGGDPESAVDPSRCPDCGRELPEQAQASGQCPYCKLAARTPGSDKKKEKGGGLGFSPVAGALLAFPIVASCLLLYVRFRQNRVYYVDECYGYFHCPYCKRRLRYLVSKAGHPGKCPLCKRPLFFPVADVRPAEFRRAGRVKWLHHGPGTW